MEPRFEVIFLEEAREFLLKLDNKARTKIVYNIDKSRFLNDPKLFKKLNDDIWEFRTRYNKLQYRLLAFWDKRQENQTLVITTHGIIKKQDKVPAKEIQKAYSIMQEYLQNN